MGNQNQQKEVIKSFVLGNKELEGKVAEFQYDHGTYTICDIVGEQRTVVFKSKNAQEAYAKWNVYIGRKKERPQREGAADGERDAERRQRPQENRQTEKKNSRQHENKRHRERVEEDFEAEREKTRSHNRNKNRNRNRNRSRNHGRGQAEND